ALAIFYPFQYSEDDLTDLGALAVQQYPDAVTTVRDWARAFVLGNPTDTLSLLKDLNTGILAWVSYESRDDEGTQTPAQTLDRRRGSCRDMAVLLMEAARSLGFGARIVSGYFYDPDRDGAMPGPAPTTHAWTEIYLPGAGWIAFDPTNGTVGGAHLVPVAVGRDIRQVMPVVGSFVGMSDAFLGMSAEVFVTS
ncbi:MAG TPA: transglutaminase family protein, partial [Stellaceae bacterium]|nr:transglutaminase family protein [Stellaceae bacterium]